MPELSRILAALAQASDEPAALATLVRVEGSSYRRPGARLLVLNSGLRIGSISGGCLEDDVVLRAQRVLATGKAETAVYDTTSENDLVWGVGLGCQGVVHIFIEPLPVIRPPWIKTLGENLRARQGTALVIVHNGANSLGTFLASEMPAGVKIPGAFSNKHAQSSITGGLASPRAADGGDAAPPPNQAEASFGVLNPLGINPSDVFQEKISAPPALVIFGAGEDARPLVRLAKEVGWHVTVVDSRPAYATPARFSEADAIFNAPATDAASQLAPDNSSFAVIMTHRYAEDLQLLRVLLPQPLAYLGVLGPRKRTDRLLAQLQTEGFAPDEAIRAQLHAPIGLDLGGNTPETVALAIMAEMQCRLTGRTPIHLRDRTAPIHG